MPCRRRSPRSTSRPPRSSSVARCRSSPRTSRPPTSPPRVGDAAADVTRVAELLAALAAPAEVVPRPAGPPIAHVTATDRVGAAIALDLFADRLLARPGEPLALRPAPGAWSLLTRP